MHAEDDGVEIIRLSMSSGVSNVLKKTMLSLSYEVMRIFVSVARSIAQVEFYYHCSTTK